MHRGEAHIQVETCTSIAVIPRFWNINTGYFLRRYVYERWGGGAAALAATQMVSGLWHGLREGHLLYFAFTIPMFHSSKGTCLVVLIPAILRLLLVGCDVHSEAHCSCCSVKLHCDGHRVHELGYPSVEPSYSCIRL